MSPSTEWREQIDADEEQRFGAYAERIVQQQRRTQRQQQAGIASAPTAL